MSVVQRTLFESELLCIWHVVARPLSSAVGEIERSRPDLLVFPVAGVFAKHDGPREHAIANANHARFVGSDQPYRISDPRCIGDECLALVFSRTALASLLAETIAIDGLNAPALATHTLLSPAGVLTRSLLWRELRRDTVDPVAIEEMSVSLVVIAARTACKATGRINRARHRSTELRRSRQVETVKEAISLHPEHPWTLGALASLANTSPYHLAHVFREEVGAPVYRYLVYTRAARGLEAVLDGDMDLTSIALEAGFATHSRFTSSFRALFGVTPSELRRRSLERGPSLRSQADASLLR